MSNIKEDIQFSVFQRCANKFTQLPFNLESDSPIRAMLVALEDQRHILLLTLHHIVADRWSVGIFMQEVAELYSVFSNGQPSSLPELSIHYGDFSAWQRNQGGRWDSHLEYWKQKLNDIPPFLKLPSERCRPPVRTYSGNVYTVELSESLSASIKLFGNRHNASLFMVMAAAFSTLLYRYTGANDIPIGYPTAGRNFEQTEHLIGFFVNTLVLRCRLQDDLSFISYLKLIWEQALQDQAHQELPFGKIIEAINPVRNASHSPLFQVMLTVQNAPTIKPKLFGLHIEQLELENHVVPFDLTLLVEERSGKLNCCFEYNTDLFDSGSLVKMAGHLQVLLDGVVNHPEMQLSHLPLLTNKERQQILADWNKNIPSIYDSQKDSQQLIYQLFERQVESAPKNIALIFADEIFNYEELNAQANQLAHYLHTQGITPDTYVGVCAKRSVELIVSLLAVHKAGGAYVPLDPDYPEKRLKYILKDSEIKCVLTQSALARSFSDCGVNVINIDNDFSDFSTQSPEPSATLDNTAYIIYTSGSTGQPKGVLVSHRNLLHSTLARRTHYQDSPDCFLLLSSFAFDSSVAGIFWTLTQGGHLCLPQQDEAKDPKAIAKLVKQHQVSHLLTLPSYYSTLIKKNLVSSLYSLKVAIVAGEACSCEIVHDHRQKLPNTKFYNEYGPTEATVWSSVYESKYEEQSASLPIGKKINDVQIYILDNHCQAVPVGIGGELV